MTPTTAQIMTENTVSQTYRATYSPDDNKLRLYASLRLDEETGTVAKLAMRQPFVLFKGLTFQKLCLP
ncbi:hypothetical protein RAH25_25595, partial [Klebsiella quasipneumoniae subsp. similipneumoniae]